MSSTQVDYNSHFMDGIEGVGHSDSSITWSSGKSSWVAVQLDLWHL